MKEFPEKSCVDVLDNEKKMLGCLFDGADIFLSARDDFLARRIDDLTERLMTLCAEVGQIQHTLSNLINKKKWGS